MLFSSWWGERGVRGTGWICQHVLCDVGSLGLCDHLRKSPCPHPNLLVGYLWSILSCQVIILCYGCYFSSYCALSILDSVKFSNAPVFKFVHRFMQVCPFLLYYPSKLPNFEVSTPIQLFLRGNLKIHHLNLWIFSAIQFQNFWNSQKNIISFLFVGVGYHAHSYAPIFKNLYALAYRVSS